MAQPRPASPLSQVKHFIPPLARSRSGTLEPRDGGKPQVQDSEESPRTGCRASLPWA